MNKQELIEKYKTKGEVCKEFPVVAISDVLKDLRELDEPQKVTVPQFVAEWIEVCKEHLTTSLYNAMNTNFMRENNQSFDFISWIKKTSNQDIFARAWLDGYVEGEKRYWVKLKAVDQYLISAKDEKFLGFLQSKLRSKFTRKELEDLGFGWVFDCEGVEVEEVE